MFVWIRTKLALGLMHFIKIAVDLICIVGFFCEAVLAYKVLEYIYSMTPDTFKYVQLLAPAWFIYRTIYWWIVSQGQGIRPALMSALRTRVFRMLRLL